MVLFFFCLFFFHAEGGIRDLVRFRGLGDVYKRQQEDLAKAIGISLQRLNAKINETGGAEFTQGEIQGIKERYKLTPDEVDNIFFASVVS